MNEKRVGLILPSANIHMEPEFYRIGLRSINFYTTRVKLQEAVPEKLSGMEKDLEYAAELISSVKPDVVAYADTTGSLINGKSWDALVKKKITSAAGCPVVTTACAKIDAVQTLGIRKIALITSCIDPINEMEKVFFEDNGIKVVAMKGLQISDAEILHAQTSKTIREMALSIDLPEAEAIFISGTDFTSLEVADELERVLAKPVITSSQATLWKILKSVGNKERVYGYGRLLKYFLV